MKPFRCPRCGAEGRSSIEANTHCSTAGLHDFGDLRPRCYACAEPLTGADIRDSKLLGTLARCRAHIVAVAPELAEWSPA